ncbi:PREDICTED: uncharacterized protein LOC108746693 [Trachymyrmex septentrionalis]|uniref:uncharacterized protein LOC108746693 n=1 Tax=Trachymyrmex septentrionalis TaxID=34720 RepID=UPI00084F30C5|nr:PREDICTED: uncharacterized protein LOC108746693 [Trachymyrmex septentrionalis]
MDINCKVKRGLSSIDRLCNFAELSRSPTTSPHDTTALISSPRTRTRKDKSSEARSRLVVVLELGRRRFEIQNKTTPIRRCHLGFKAGDSPLSRLLDSVKLNPFNESEIHHLEKKDGRKARQQKYPERRKTKVKGEESRVFISRKEQEDYSIK